VAAYLNPSPSQMLNDVLEAPYPYLIGTPNAVFHAAVADPEKNATFMALTWMQKRSTVLRKGTGLELKSSCRCQD
jgi:hypothetical protein